MAIPLSPDFIEHIHDVLVGAFLPFDEKVNPAEHRNRGYIESAAGRPFHTVGGQDLWPSLAEKAAALFHSLACNHCFINGNKRTAVIALDLFLAVNQHLLAMSSDDVYVLAKSTATANLEGRDHDLVMRDLATQIEASIFDLEMFQAPLIRERLGSDFDRVLQFIERKLALGQRIVDEHRILNN